MPDMIDGQRAAYANTPAWHRKGRVSDGWMTAAEALDAINPNKEPVRKVTAAFKFGDKYYDIDDQVAIIDIDQDTGLPRFLSYTDPTYGLVTLEQKFAFLDEVVGAVDGAHYEAAAGLRNGRQTIITIAMKAIALDPNGRNDIMQQFLFASNSYDRSWPFRVKYVGFRVECANMAAMALRGSTNKIVPGDWSTKHTKNIMGRVEAAQKTLSLYKEYGSLYEAQCEELIETPMHDNTFKKILSELFEVKNSPGEVDETAVNEVRAVYELNSTQMNLYGTMWGGFNAVTYYNDHLTKVRGGKTMDVNDSRLIRQLEDNRTRVGETVGLKQRAWDLFWDAHEAA